MPYAQLHCHDDSLPVFYADQLGLIAGTLAVNTKNPDAGNSRITEKFDMKQGDKVEPPVYTQDIILYRYPCITNIGTGAVSPLAVSGAELRTTFPVSPSKDYTIVELLLGKVGLEILVPATAENGVMVGTGGGRLVDADGKNETHRVRSQLYTNNVFFAML